MIGIFRVDNSINRSTDANLITVDKIYPNIEIYLNSLVEKITVMKIQLFNKI